MGLNGNYFSGINGNWTVVEDFQRPGNEMGGNRMEWVHESNSRTFLLQDHGT